MTKLCPRGKAAAKRKFKVYPSAYANAYASKICAGKIKDPSGVKRKDFRGPKPSKAMGGRIFKDIGGPVIGSVKRNIKDNQDRIIFKRRAKSLESRPKDRKVKPIPRPPRPPKPFKRRGIAKPKDPREFQKLKQPAKGMMGGGMMRMPRAMYNKGGSTGKIPTTPKEKKFATLAPPKDRITYSDKIAGATGRTMARGGGLMEATSRLRSQGLKNGGVARGCGAIMSNRRKKTKIV